MKAPDISIIIPHRDDHAGLERTITAVSRQDPSPLQIEVVVADNASTGGVEAVHSILGRHATAINGTARVIEAKEIGAGPARNAAAAVANGRILVFLVCDCLPRPNWLQAVIKAMDATPIAGGPVTVVRLADAQGPPSAAEAFDLLFGFDVPRSFRRDGLLLTANLAVRADAFRAIGHFRRAISEDMEWCNRAEAMGYPLRLEPAMEVAHVAMDSQKRLVARWDRITLETFLYRRERGLGNFGWLWYLMKVAASPALHAPRALLAQLGPGTGPAFRLHLCLLLTRIRWRRTAYGLRLVREKGLPSGW